MSVRASVLNALGASGELDRTTAPAITPTRPMTTPRALKAPARSRERGAVFCSTRFADVSLGMTQSLGGTQSLPVPQFQHSCHSSLIPAFPHFLQVHMGQSAFYIMLCGFNSLHTQLIFSSLVT